MIDTSSAAIHHSQHTSCQNESQASRTGDDHPEYVEDSSARKTFTSTRARFERFLSTIKEDTDPQYTAYYCFLTKNQWIKLIIIAVYFLVGCLFYGAYEGWSPQTSIGFTIITVATVGYGYHHPTSDTSRLFTIFYLVFGVYCACVGIVRSLKASMDRAAAYISTLTDATNLFTTYNYHRRMIALNIIAIISCNLIGAAILCSLEDWSFIEGFYFAIETTSTVGYGDLEISNSRTHIFLGFYIIFSALLISFAFKNFQLLRAQKDQLDKIEQMTLRTKDLQFLVGMDKGEGINEDQFVLAILRHLGTIKQETDIDPWLKKFRELQPDSKGKVYRETLYDFSVRESMHADQLALLFSGAIPGNSVASSVPDGSFAFSFNHFAGAPYQPPATIRPTQQPPPTPARQRANRNNKDELRVTLLDSPVSDV